MLAAPTQSRLKGTLLAQEPPVRPARLLSHLPGTPSTAAGTHADGFAPKTAEARFYFLFWLLLSPTGWAEGCGCSLLLAGVSPQQVDFSWERAHPKARITALSATSIEPEWPSRQGKSLAASSLCLQPGLSPFPSREGCGHTNTASLTCTSVPPDTGCPQESPHLLPLVFYAIPAHSSTSLICRDRANPPDRGESEGIGASTAQGAQGRGKKGEGGEGGGEAGSQLAAEHNAEMQNGL